MDPWCLCVPISEWRGYGLYPRSASTIARDMCRGQKLDLVGGSWHCRGHPVLTLVTINTDLALWVWLFCSVCTETVGEFADPAPVKRPLDPLRPPCSSHILGTEGQTMLLSSSGSRHLCKRRGSKANGFSGELGIKWGTWQSNYS